jgi:hypothetical protein
MDPVTAKAKPEHGSGGGGGATVKAQLGGTRTKTGGLEIHGRRPLQRPSWTVGSNLQY